MTSLTGADVTASLLDALVEVADATGAPEQTDALIERLGERIARSLAAPCHATTLSQSHADDGAALALRIEALAAQLLPGSHLLAPPTESSSELTVCLPLPGSSGSLDVEPPVRIRLVASALGWLAAQETGQTQTPCDLRLDSGLGGWLQTIRLCESAGSPLPRARERGAARSYLASPAHGGRVGGGGSSPPGTGAPHHGAGLSELAASVAHGLNNLLAAVAGESSLLLDAADGADAVTVRASGLRLIHQAALDGAGLAQRLLRASRGEPADSPAADALELVDLGRVLVDAVDLTRLRWHDEARQRGIRIDIAVHVEQPLLIRGVAADLREIVVNLILNGVDAMPAGGRLTLHGGVHDEVVTVRCEDTGGGMSPDVLARVFEPFFTTKGAAGTGMGMAILYGVVARHGGEVQVSSRLGEGTTITMQLPAAQLTLGVRGAGHAQSRRGSPPPIDLGPDLEALSVLVVEDDPSFRAVFARRLALDARRVEAVSDAASALLLLETGAWDLVCVDERLPDASGQNLAAEIHRRGLAAAVILVTGSALGPDDPVLVTLGVDAVLPKPCTDAELAVAVRSAAARVTGRLEAPA